MSQSEPTQQPSVSPSAYVPTSYEEGSRTRDIILPAALLFLVGAFQIITGLQAINEEGFFEAPPNYYYNWDPTFWGWTHLIFGVILAVCAVLLLFRKGWAGYLAIALAGLSAMWNFILIFWFPVWAIVTIALDVLVIWSLSRSDAIEDW
jgi:hypothetical protein